MAVPPTINLAKSIDELEFLPDRTPGMEQPPQQWVATLAKYRDGGLFIVNYAGSSEWERHGVGDEVVMVVDGSTTMTLYVDGQEHKAPLGPGELVIVPQGVWHRFDTPDGAKIMTITPQPTDHMTEHPSTLD